MAGAEREVPGAAGGRVGSSGGAAGVRARGGEGGTGRGEAGADVSHYTAFAGLYDLVAAEPVYRAGRLAALADLDLRPGARVLDLGCGTGLNLPGLVQAVGSSGQVIGVDAAPRMLDVAAGKARAAGWSQVRLVRADATTLSAEDLDDD